MASTINATTSSGIVTTADNTGSLALQTSGTTAVTIDTSQNVGIGTTSPASKLNVASGNLRLSDGYQLEFGGGVDSISGSNASHYLLFYTNNTERMRITAAGQVLINSTTAPIGSAPMALKNGTINWSMGPNGGGNFILYNDSAIGLYLLNGGTSWTGTSDERVKTDLKPIENAAEKVSTLRAVTGRFITDEENKSRAFLIAQDVQKVLPEAVDASDPEKLGIAYTDVIPLLTAAIKEQQTIINNLKARIETLEAK